MYCLNAHRQTRTQRVCVHARACHIAIKLVRCEVSVTLPLLHRELCSRPLRSCIASCARD